MPMAALLKVSAAVLHGRFRRAVRAGRLPAFGTSRLKWKGRDQTESIADILSGFLTSRALEYAAGRGAATHDRASRVW